MKRYLILPLFLLALFPATLHSASAKEHIVQVISDYDKMRMAFEPQMLTIMPGDSVKWVNQKPETHNMITYPDGYPEGAQAFSSPFLEKANDTWSHTFTKSGTYEYHCIPHLMMGMRGKIIVGKPTEDGKFHNPTPAERTAYRKKLLEFFDEETINKIQTKAATDDTKPSEHGSEMKH